MYHPLPVLDSVAINVQRCASSDLRRADRYECLSGRLNSIDRHSLCKCFWNVCQSTADVQLASQIANIAVGPIHLRCR